MIVKTYQNSDDWFSARRGKVTGSKVGKLVSKRNFSPLEAYYGVLAEKISVPPSDEYAMDRGKRLESYAIERFTEETGIEVNTDLILWEREDNPDMAVSPDGVIGDECAVEAKCLSSAKHIEAYLTRKKPDEYNAQAAQYFIVNDKLDTLYFVFFDPRCVIDFFYLIFNRADLEEDITFYRDVQEKVLKEINAIVDELTFKK